MRLVKLHTNPGLDVSFSLKSFHSRDIFKFQKLSNRGTPAKVDNCLDEG